MERPRTLGDLRASGYRPTPVKVELRRNLLHALREGRPLFPGIVGYDDTVLPRLQNALLARHDFLLLGLRGQAKTRLLRSLTALLDDTLPILAGSEINDDPFAPLSAFGRDVVSRLGDASPIEWIGRERRYTEKLATPDTTVADLLGEIDWARHLEGRALADERLLHFGLVPRANRGIFCLNELPDLAPRVQVALFNVLEERDVQVRGFPVRLPLDLCVVFSANPEDYTNRGRIVTPLKDRIGSVIETHYPHTRAEGLAILQGNANLQRDGIAIHIPDFLLEVVEEFVRLARRSPSVNTESGVSVRLSITAAELLASNAERRALLLGESEAVPRLSDLAAIDAAARGKVELAVADDTRDEELFEQLRGQAVKVIFEERCSNLEHAPIVNPFQRGLTFTTGDHISAERHRELADRIPALAEAAAGLVGRGASGPRLASAVEFVLEGLTQLRLLRRVSVDGSGCYQGEPA
jgi:magnesium chelatase subunit I